MTTTDPPDLLLARLRDLETQNERLRRLLDQGGATAELRHRQRNLLATLRQVIQRSAISERSLEEFQSQLDDRLAALGRIHAAIDVYGGIDLHNIVAEELLFNGLPEGESLHLKGPAILLTPAAGQTLALAVHELAVNSVEHGAIGSREGQLQISWEVLRVPGEDMFRFTWIEPNVNGGLRGRPGYGTRFLQEVLPYELSAEVEMDLSATSLTCRLTFPFNAEVGTARD